MSSTRDEIRYMHIGQLLQERPEFVGLGELSDSEFQWLGRVGATLEPILDMARTMELNVALGNVLQGGTRARGLAAINLLLHRVLAQAEATAPPELRGSFIGVGRGFTALQAVTRVFGSATTELLVVDPYLDGTVLVEFGGAIPEGVRIRLLADRRYRQRNDELRPAVTRWAQERGTTHPIEARVTAPQALHDRLFVVDRQIVYNVSQSIRDLAGRSPASIIRLDEVTAGLKVQAYDALWDAASALVV
ncbi:hypothetical protein [Lysobacter sp. HA35]